MGIRIVQGRLLQRIMRLVTICLFTLPFYPILAQTSSQWLKAAEDAVNDQDWPTAEAYYYEAFVLDSTDLHLAHHYALALRMNKKYEKAAYYYQEIFDKDRGRTYPEAQFWLALMQKHEGSYTESMRNFKKVSKKFKRDKESYVYRKSSLEMDACKWVLQQRRDDSAIKINPLEESVNSQASEISPFYWDSTLYFSAASKTSSLFQAYKTSYDSIAGERIPTSQDFPLQISNLSFSGDGSIAICAMCDSLNRCDIYWNTFGTPDWEDFEKMPFINKANSSSTMPYLASIEGNKVLFFSSNRSGGEGGLDIWWSEFDGDDPTPPVNAGTDINSPDQELSPFYLDGSLYFSSNWHQGFGGFDLFKSTGKHRSFSAPENLGYPLNTNANEMYYTYDVASKRGFFASNRLGSYQLEGESCCNDIYTFQYKDSLENEGLRIANLNELNKYLPVVLYFHNDEPNPNTRDTTTTLAYSEAYDSYKALSKTYVREIQKGLDGEEKENAKEEVDEWYELHVDKGYGDLELFASLLLEELKKGTDVELSIRGFASPRAESDYNVNLTKRRTGSLINHLDRYQGGVLRPFIEGTDSIGGRLRFIEIPFGEYQADSTVNDDLMNEQASIYSRSARLERKIMIESVQRTRADNVSPILFTETNHNFGIIPDAFPVEHTFVFYNTDADTLVIDSLKTSCGCTVPEISRYEIPPGESSEIRVVFDPHGIRGAVVRTILVYTRDAREPEKLQVVAEVE